MASGLDTTENSALSIGGSLGAKKYQWKQVDKDIDLFAREWSGTVDLANRANLIVGLPPRRRSVYAQCVWPDRMWEWNMRRHEAADISDQTCGAVPLP